MPIASRGRNSRKTESVWDSMFNRRPEEERRVKSGAHARTKRLRELCSAIWPRLAKPRTSIPEKMYPRQISEIGDQAAAHKSFGANGFKAGRCVSQRDRERSRFAVAGESGSIPNNGIGQATKSDGRRHGLIDISGALVCHAGELGKSICPRVIALALPHRAAT